MAKRDDRARIGRLDAGPSAGPASSRPTQASASALPGIIEAVGALRRVSVVVLLRQGMQLARAPHALRWRLETFGLYMPSLPEERPWWRVNARALRALLRQLPGYARWLGQMHTLRLGGARALWQARGANVHAWEEWLARSEQ